MKKITIILCSLTILMATEVIAQELPTKGFIISLKDKSVKVSQGKTTEINVDILRSKSFTKTNIDLIVATALPEGVNIVFNDGIDGQNRKTMVITVAEDAPAFNQMIMIKGVSNKLSKATMLTITSQAQQTLSSR